MKYHPISNIFPLLAKPELDELAQDIKSNGLRQPIMLLDGQILDGRNRYRACEIADVKPRFETFCGGSPTAFVISLNLTRRHLNPGQKATCATEALPWLEKEAADRKKATEGRPRKGAEKPTQRIEGVSRNDGLASEQAAALFGTNRQYVSDAKDLKKNHPKEFEQVKNGEKTIPEVKRAIRREKNMQVEAAATAKATPGFVITADQQVVPCAALITDPPYGILKESWEPKELKGFTTGWLKAWGRCGADFIVSFWSQRYLFEGKEWFDDNLSDYKFQQLLVWHYPNNKSPQSRTMFKQTWEPIFLYRRIGSTRKITVSSAEWGQGLNDFDCHVAAVPQTNFNGSEMKQHPAQKPLSVMRWLVNAVSDFDEIVADPFCGVGTTGIAAVGLKRRFHGIESDPAFLEITKQRILAYGG